MEMVIQALAVLNNKLFANEVSADILAKVEQLVHCLVMKNYAGANAIQNVIYLVLMVLFGRI